MFINSAQDILTVVYLYNGILYSNENEYVIATCNDIMDPRNII